MASHQQHRLEFGGSAVGTEFDGALQFQLLDRIPLITVSQDFTEKTARQIRYALVATVGPERPFYHRHLFVVLDVRMIGKWQSGAGGFVAALAERMNRIGGSLFVVTTDPLPQEAQGVPTFDSPDAGLEAARTARREKRSALLQTTA